MQPVVVVIVGIFVLAKVPLKYKFPAPENVNRQPVVPVFIVPLILTVPVEMVIILFLLVVLAFMVSEPAVRVPAPTAIVKFVLLLPGLIIFTRPVTDREFDPLMVNRPVFTVVKVLQTAAIFTVTVIPLLIITSSEEVGTEDPPQVAVLFQLPLTDAVLVAPKPLNPSKRNTIAGNRYFRVKASFVNVG